MPVNTDICEAILNAGIEYVVCVPDSIAAPLIKKIIASGRIKYIQASHEADCVGISTGLNLTGKRSIVIMESSGLRNACEMIARFHLSHALYNMYIITHRGSFGERNWWGQAHHTTLHPLLELLRFRWAYIDNPEAMVTNIHKALDDFDARQSSSALIVHPEVFKQ